jgi:Fic family protein
MFENKIPECEEQKKIIDTFRPLSQDKAKELKEHYKIGLTYSSNALEGNTLTLIETKVIIEDGLTIGGKTLNEIHEATGHAKAYDFIYTLLEKKIDVNDVLKIHQLFYQQIDSEKAGQLRLKNVFVTGLDTKFPPFEKVQSLMQEFEEALANPHKLHPIHHAAIIHNQLVTIHPFVDGNGRTARLLMNLLLIKAGYSITIVPPVFRSDYIKCAYEGNKGNHQEFINFLSCMVYESQREMIRMLK